MICVGLDNDYPPYAGFGVSKKSCWFHMFKAYHVDDARNFSRQKRDVLLHYQIHTFTQCFVLKFITTR